MTDKLPPNLLSLFAARPALRYLPAADHAPENRRTAQITGLAAYKHLLDVEHDPDWKPTESSIEKKDRETFEREQHQLWLTKQGAEKLYKPNEDKNIRGDAFKTLFVGRLSYDTEVRDLEQAFSRYGHIERVRIVTDNGESTKGTEKKNKKGQSRGYGFVVFDRESDMKAAYKNTGDIMIKGRRVCVDVERGRTVAGWRPRRFGGGLGGRHYTKAPTRMPGFGPPAGIGGFRGGGFRGGFRGGDRGGGFRGGRGGGGPPRDRGYGGLGYNGTPPDGAPAGPRGGGGFGSSFDGGRGGYRSRSGYGGDRDDRGPPRSYDDGPPRGGYRDRDASSSSYSSGQKRPYDGGGGYDDSRARKRY